MSLTTVNLVGTVRDGALTGLNGYVELTPTADVIDTVDAIILKASRIRVPVTSGTLKPTPIVPNDAVAGATWFWGVTENIRGLPLKSYTVQILTSDGPNVDLSKKAPVSPPSPLPNLTITNSGSSGQVLTSEGGFEASFQDLSFPPQTPQWKPWQFPITDHGAAGNLNCVVDAVMTNGSAIVTSASGQFTAAMAARHMPSVVKGAVAGGQSSLVTTVASYQSPTQVTLAAPATASGTGLQMLWGDDDTVAAQAAVQAGMSWDSPFGIVAEIWTPPSPSGYGYMMAGQLKQTDGVNAVYNSQITIPLNSGRLPGKKIKFIGAGGGDTRFWDQDYPMFQGSTWFSAGVFASQSAQANSITAHGNPSVIGGPTGANGYGTSAVDPLFNNVTVEMIDMAIMTTHSDSGWTYCPFNFFGCARAHLDRCGFGTNGVVQYYKSFGLGDFANVGDLAGGLSFGGIMPANGNNDSNRIRDCVWNGGYTYGPVFMEHTVGEGCNASNYNWVGIAIAGNYGDGGTGAGALHVFKLGQFSCEGSLFHLGIIGEGESGNGPQIHGVIDTEGAVQIRDNEGGIDLAAAKGVIMLGGSGAVTPQTTFPTGLQLIRMVTPVGPVSGPPAITANTAICNTTYRHVTIYLAGGTGVTTIQKSSLAGGQGGADTPAMSTMMDFTGVGVVPIGTKLDVGPGQWFKINCTTPPSAQWDAR